MTSQYKFKGIAFERHLASALSDAAVDLKRKHGARTSESVIVQAALLRFLRQTRPGCQHVGKFLEEQTDHAIRIQFIAAVPTVSEAYAQ